MAENAGYPGLSLVTISMACPNCSLVLASQAGFLRYPEDGLQCGAGSHNPELWGRLLYSFFHFFLSSSVFGTGCEHDRCVIAKLESFPPVKALEQIRQASSSKCY